MCIEGKHVDGTKPSESGQKHTHNVIVDDAETRRITCVTNVAHDGAITRSDGHKASQFVIDSGASSHFTADRGLFRSYVALKPRDRIPVEIADGKTL
ncbi:hypothetical protein HK105_201889 [Polyrhizophydium stewartii]|uniref:Uncharacterized protein n=1 Tax=Polyrhizophydium stewartii TaxID=2732419 RepID=A0ABR4NG36_9FUNG